MIHTSAYIRDWAKHVKSLQEPVFIRFANEMNGDWDPWCTWFFSKDYDLYINAWRHVHNIFKQEGAGNASHAFLEKKNLDL